MIKLDVGSLINATVAVYAKRRMRSVDKKLRGSMVYLAYDIMPDAMFNVAVCDVKHGENEKEEMVEMMVFVIDRRNNVYIMQLLLLPCEVGRER